MIDTTLPEHGTRRVPAHQRAVSPSTVIMLAISCGLAGGYLDLVFIVSKKFLWNGLKNYANAHDFPWSVPVGHVVLLLIPAALLGGCQWLRPKPISMRAATWLFSALAIWAALLRLPLYGVCTLAPGRRTRAAVQWLDRGPFSAPRQARLALSGLLGLLVILAAFSSGWHALREYRAMANLPAPPSNARNVLLIVWDTVRASNLSVYGHPRNTTPNLARWAQRGVRYNLALAPAPWTYPSHSSFFTGHWPFQLRSQWKYTLDAPVPTLAEHLLSRGYQTAGFSANTLNCTYESRLDRGFTHFEDYPLTPRSFLSRTVAGSWILEKIVYRGDFFQSKWIRIQSRDASAINESFVGWLQPAATRSSFLRVLELLRRPRALHTPDRDMRAVSGSCPVPPRDYQFLLDYGTPGWKSVPNRDIAMARDCYDDCIAFLDDQLGRLLDELERPGASRQHGRDHHIGPRGIVRRSWPVPPRHQPLPRRDRRPAGDPVARRARQTAS